MTSSHIGFHTAVLPRRSHLKLRQMRGLSFDVPSVLVFILLEWVSYYFLDIMDRSLSVNVRVCTCLYTSRIGLIVLMCPAVLCFLDTMNGSRSFDVQSCPCFDTL